MTAVRPGPATRAARPRKRADRAIGTRYLNRELSWMEWNARVLHEASDERNPLLERVSSSRSSPATWTSSSRSGCRSARSGRRGQQALAPDGLTPVEQLARIQRARPGAHRRAIGDLRPSSARSSRASRSRSSTTPRSRSTTRRSASVSSTRSSRSSRRWPSTPAIRSRTSARSACHRGRAARPGDRRAALRAGQDPAGPAPRSSGRPAAASCSSTK